MTIMRTLRYGLIATAMNYKQCDRVMKDFLQGVLSKMGFIRTANMRLAISPRNMQGIGLIHLYILQLVDHLKILCNHGGEETNTGTRKKLEALTIQTGKGGSPFNFNPAKIPWIEHSWWMNTVQACHQYNIQIQGATNQLNQWTTNDTFLMDNFEKTYNPDTFQKFFKALIGSDCTFK